MSSTSEGPLALLRKPFFFKDTIWLGGKHDGYPLVPVQEYLQVRRASDGTTPRNVLEMARETQCHLTFGLLEGALEIKIPESTMLRQNDRGETVMHSDNLDELLWDCRYRIQQLGRGEKCKQWAIRMQTTLERARALLSLEVTHSPSAMMHLARTQPYLMDSIFCLIASIGEVLTIMLRRFPRGLLPLKPGGISWMFISNVAKGIRPKMISNGWCPFTIEMCDSICVIGYMSTCRPYNRETSTEHEKCTSRSCVRNTIDTSNYTRKHTTLTCECAYSKPALEDIVGSLSNGKIPIIQISTTPDGEFDTIKSGSDSSQAPYVALSHVWADGLGSTTEEGLPTCQIKRLATMTTQVVPGGAFWMDALCVPSRRDMRKRAIGLMAQTYRVAAAVLVIDGGIRSCSLSASPEEKLLRVMSSGWMQRLWTLQEAVLARRLVFEFSDGLATADELLLASSEDRIDPVVSYLSAELYRLIKSRQHPNVGSGFRLGDVGNALRFRTSSKVEDETLAISGLLNIDAFELVNLPPEHRMKTFLLRIQKLPPSIIFMSGAKLRHEPGFRWAPRSLMQPVGASVGNGECVATCTPTELVSEYVGLIFPEIHTDRQLHWFFRSITNERFYKSTDLAGDPSVTAYSFNAILVQQLPMNYEVRKAAAVLIDVVGRDGNDDENRMVCEFKKTLVLTHVSEEQVEREKPAKVVQVKSGRMKLRVT